MAIRDEQAPVLVLGWRVGAYFRFACRSRFDVGGPYFGIATGFGSDGPSTTHRSLIALWEETVDHRAGAASYSGWPISIFQIISEVAGCFGSLTTTRCVT